MVPHERSLVNRMKGKPFVFLGVNCDGDMVENVKSVIAARKMNWRNWINHTAVDARITTSYKAIYLPNLYLIDHKGIIRFHRVGPVRGEVLDRKVEELVAKAEKAARKKR